MRRRHLPIPEQGQWLASVVRGHSPTTPCPATSTRSTAFRDPGDTALVSGAPAPQPAHPLNWERMYRLATRWLPPARIMHPFPTCDSTLAPKAGAQCVSSARWDLRGGPPSKGGPYRDRDEDRRGGPRCRDRAVAVVFRVCGDIAKRPGFCAGLPGRCGSRMRPARPGTGWRASSRSVGVECVVAAPSKIPRASGDRVKTDRRDAEHLVRLLLAGKLHAVRVPGPEEEALRDLVRAREAVRVDLMRSRHRLSKLLLRHGIRFDDGQAWTERHRDWLATVTLEWPAAQATLLDAQGAIDALVSPPRQLGARDRRAAPELAVGGAGRPAAVPARGRHADRGRAVRRDRRLRAVRPRRAADELRRAGPVRVNDRAAAPARVDHQDRVRARPPAAGRGRLALPQRAPRSARRSPSARTASPPEAIAIAWSAQRRLHRTWTRLEARAKRRTIIAVAAARELAGFCWAITQIE